jgi:VWFA-related protein
MPRPSVLLLAIFAATAQTPNAPQQEPPETVIRINVNLVQVDAVVTDSKDRPVKDLRAEDFEILQDGKPQTITNFSYISLGPPAAAAPRPTPAKGAPPVPPARLKPGEVKRTIALVVDDLGIAADNIVYLRWALKKFVDQQMQPGDLVAIIRTGAGIGALQQFTSDKRMLYAAIDRVKYNALGRVGLSSFEPLGAASSPLIDTERNQAFTVGTIGAVKYVMEGLREVPGRKALVLFSENLKLFRDDSSDRVLSVLHQLTDAANRASVVIYTVDPRGLQVHGLTAADDVSTALRNGMTEMDIANISSTRSADEFDSREGLVMLAHETGGRFFANTNDLSGAIRSVMQDTEGYYLIGYHPSAETFDAKSGQPKFHKVAVKVKRPGLRLRSRSGFIGTSDHAAPAVPRGREAQISRALTSPFAAGSIHVRMTPLFSQGPKGSFLNTLLYIEGKDLKFTDEPDGWHKAVIDLVAITFGDNGQPIDSSDRTYTLRARNESYEQTVKGGVLYAVSHPVRKPGAYQMRVVVRDTTTEEVGSASQFIEVPDVGKGRLTMSSVIIREQANLQQRPAEQAEGQIAAPNFLGTPAVRIFKQGQSLLYGYEVLNAKIDSGTKLPRLEVQSRLFRDGKPVYEGKVMPLKAEILPDGKRMVAGGSLKLGATIAPGDYVLQVTVTDNLAKEKYRMASQWIDFEIQ